MAESNVNISNGTATKPNVGFLLGSQAALDALRNATTKTAIPGTFYLTNDTHRLYIGNQDKTISPVNQGVITVDYARSNESGFQSGTHHALPDSGEPGQFYFVKNGQYANALCTWSKGQWIQINIDTCVEDFKTIVSATNDVATITNTIEVSDSSNPDTKLYLTGEGGLQITKDTAKTDNNGLKLKSENYTLNADTTNQRVALHAVNQNSDAASIKFVTATSTASSVTTNTAVSKSGNVVTVKITDTQLSATSTPAATANTTKTGFTVAVEDTAANKSEHLIDPIIKYGKTSTGVAGGTEAKFGDGTAANAGKLSLDVYTTGQVDALMQGINAMHYMGPCDTVTKSTDGTKITSLANAGSTLSGFHIGDTYLYSSGNSFTLKVGSADKTYKTGSLLIANGTEGTDGVITASSLYFDVIPETYYPDTTYTIQNSGTNEVGIKLVPSTNTSGSAGKLLFAGANATGTKAVATANAIAVSDSGTTDTTVTISHANFFQGGTASTSTYARNNSKVSITPVTGLTVNSTGHITGYTTQTIDIEEADLVQAGSFSNVALSSDKKTATLTNKVTLERGLSTETSDVTLTSEIKSSTLTLTATERAYDTSTKKETAPSLTIDLTWGTF